MNKDKILTKEKQLDDAFKPIKFISKEDQTHDLGHEDATYNRNGVYKQVKFLSYL